MASLLGIRTTETIVPLDAYPLCNSHLFFSQVAQSKQTDFRFDGAKRWFVGRPWRLETFVNDSLLVGRRGRRLIWASINDVYYADGSLDPLRLSRSLPKTFIRQLGAFFYPCKGSYV